MYSIILTDGKIINVDADKVEWYEKTRTLRLLKGRQIVARINMDNAIGWIDVDYLEQKESWEE